MVAKGLGHIFMRSFGFFIVYLAISSTVTFAAGVGDQPPGRKPGDGPMVCFAISNSRSTYSTSLKKRVAAKYVFAITILGLPGIQCLEAKTPCHQAISESCGEMASTCLPLFSSHLASTSLKRPMSKKCARTQMQSAHNTQYVFAIILGLLGIQRL